MITFTAEPALIIQLVLTLIMPLVVGLVSTKATAGAIKAWLLAGLTLLTSILTGLGDALATGSTFDLGASLLIAIPAFAISVSTYYGLWKPTGVGGTAQEFKPTTLIHDKEVF